MINLASRVLGKSSFTTFDKSFCSWHTCVDRFYCDFLWFWNLCPIRSRSILLLFWTWDDTTFRFEAVLGQLWFKPGTFPLVEMRMHGPRENTTMLYLGPPTTHYVTPRKQVKIPGIPDHTDNSTVDFMYVTYHAIWHSTRCTVNTVQYSND